MGQVTGITPELQDEIFKMHRELKRMTKACLHLKIQLGKRLLLAKAQCSHGEFLAWLKAHFTERDKRTYQNYMQIARAYPNPDDAPDLPLRRLLRQIQRPAAGAPSRPGQSPRSARARPAGLCTRSQRISLPYIKAALAYVERSLDAAVATSKVFVMEGLTKHHRAMKQLKKTIKELRELRDQLRSMLVCWRKEMNFTDTPQSVRAAADFFNLNWPCTAHELEVAYRLKISVYDPENGGDREMFEGVQAAYAVLHRAVGAKAVECAAAAGPA